MTKKLGSYAQTLTNYVLGLRDVRNVGQLVFICMVLLISWSGVKAIQTNIKRKSGDSIALKFSLSEVAALILDLGNS